MKRLLAIAIASVLLLSACGQNESIPFSASETSDRSSMGFYASYI